MKNKILILLCAVIASFFLSCEKDFLEVPSENLTAQSVWADPVLAESFIVGLYTSIKASANEEEHADGSGDQAPAGFGRGNSFQMWSSLTDESFYIFDATTHSMQKGLLSPSSNDFIKSAWSRNYRAIRECNLAMENVNSESSVFDVDKARELTAEIRFIRAYRYFELWKNFGRVSIVGDKVYTLTDDFTPLYDQKEIPEVLDYIVSELDAAIAGGLKVDNGERGNIDAAMALKSRALLYGASPLFTNEVNDPTKWSAAAQAAEEVMDLGRYSLVRNFDTDPTENYRKLFINQTKTPEDIFMRFYQQVGPGNGKGDAMERLNGPNGDGGWGGNCPMQNFVDDFEMSNGLPITDPGSGYDPQDPYTNRDPRLDAIVTHHNSPVLNGRLYDPTLPGGADSPEGNEGWNASQTGYLLRKFMNLDVAMADINKQGTSPWRYFRYAEILLSYAEAQNEAVGPDQSVHDAVNDVRDRAGMPDLPTGLSQSEMRTAIQNERRIELSFEEHRYFDERRWKIAMTTANEPLMGMGITNNGGGSFTYTPRVVFVGRAFTEKLYWAPIPASEIDASNNMLEQNPGY